MHVLFEDLTVAGEALVSYFLEAIVGRDWLIEDDISGRVLCVMLKQANAQYSAHPQNPLLTTKARSMREGLVSQWTLRRV